MSDDLGMEALSGDAGTRASGVVAAGCDVALHCSGKMAEMKLVAAAVQAMSPDSVARLARAMATILVEDDGVELAEALATRDALLALV